MTRFNTSRNEDRSNQSDNDDWKAEGFINMYLPKKNPDGSTGKFKLGAIPVKDKGAMAKLVEMLKKDPEGAIKAISANLTLDYQSATGASKVEFAFTV